MDARQKAAWREADRVLDGLLDLAPEARPAALAAMPIDDEVRGLVQRLLAAHARPTGPLEGGMGPELAALGFDHADGDDPLLERRLGRWRLEEQVGLGGMAAVYRAVSTETPVGQQAAVKVLTLGALASGGRERFLREQRLLSRLRHPGIVPLYDAGIAEDGTPWLAMALIDGERIDSWCEQHRLGIEARVDLVLQVAEALSHAHRSLVIHRDIKPSNVLVDGDGHVQLLDFGIARLDDATDSERTVTSLRALTPEYAAPEQFLGAPPSTAMDVYGLGALLYRILTGAAPRSQGRDGAESMPAPPSRAVRHEAAAARPWARRLRGDLDTIVLKALAPLPEHRYSGVEALAEDLRRWRGRRPILARAQSWRYRVGRFAARHRWGVAAGALTTLTLLAGVGGTLWQAQQARQQAALAEAAQRDTVQALARSNAIRDFLFELFRTTAPGEARDQMPTTAELLAAAVEQLEARFRDDPLTQAEFLSAIAEVYYQRGLPDHLVHRRRLLQLLEPHRVQHADAYAAAQADLAHSLAATDQAASARLFEEAIAHLERAAPGSKELAYAYRRRATLHMHRADGPARLRDSERAWRILGARDDVSARERFFVVAALAAGYHQAGDYAQALDHYDQAFVLGRSVFGQPHAHLAMLGVNRGGAASSMGRYAEAEAALRKSLAEYDQTLEAPREYTLAAWRELEILYARQGLYDQALRARDEWDRVLQAVAPDNQREQAKSRLWRARKLAHLQRYDQAEQLLRVAMPVLEEISTDHRNRLMGATLALRLACVRALAPAPGLEERALSLAREMNGQDLLHAADAHAAVGYCALRSGDPGQALVQLSRAAELDAQLPEGEVAQLAEHLLWQGEALAALGQGERARARLVEAARRMQAAGLQAHPLMATLERASR